MAVVLPKVGQRRFQYHPWQGKERAYVNALKSWDYVPVSAANYNVRFGLFDLDMGSLLVRMRQLHKYKIPIFLYPHAARTR